MLDEHPNVGIPGDVEAPHTRLEQLLINYDYALLFRIPKYWEEYIISVTENKRKFF
jgi:hypothetical protein